MRQTTQQGQGKPCHNKRTQTEAGSPEQPTRRDPKTDRPRQQAVRFHHNKHEPQIKTNRNERKGKMTIYKDTKKIDALAAMKLSAEEYAAIY